MNNYKDPTIADIARHFSIKYEDAEAMCDLAHKGNQLAKDALLRYESYWSSNGAKPNLEMAMITASAFVVARQEERRRRDAIPFYERHGLCIAIIVLVIIAFCALLAPDKHCASGDDGYGSEDFEQIGNGKYLK